MDITTVLSDLGNVVVLFDNRRTIMTLEHLMRAGGVGGDALSSIEAILFDMRAGLWNLFERGMIEGVRTPRIIAETLGLPRDRKTIACIEQAWTDIFALNEPVVRLWRDLRERGYVLTATSNIDALRYRACVSLGVNALFDHETLSFEEGMLKQDGPEFFARALDRSGCKAEEAFYVDDRQDCLDVASALGIRTFLYDFNDHKALEQELIRFGALPMDSQPS